MATKMFEVQQKMYAALTSNPDLATKVTGVFDFVPEDQAMPYLTFGKIESNTDRTKTELDGETLMVTLDIWSISKGRKESIQILTLVEQILEENLILDTAEIYYHTVKHRDVVEEQYGLYHATVVIEYQLDWEMN